MSPIKKVPQRIVLYPRDIANITGLSSATCRRLMQKAKTAFAKSPDEFLTVKEFCAFYGFEEELVREFLSR